MSQNETDRDATEGQQEHPKCEMWDCLGSPDDELHLVREESGDITQMCDGCLNSGYDVAVEEVLSWDV